MNHAVGGLFREGALKAEQVAGDPLTLTVPPVHDVAHSGYGALGSIAVACAVIGFDDQTPRPPLPRWPFVPPALVRASSSSAASHCATAATSGESSGRLRASAAWVVRVACVRMSVSISGVAPCCMPRVFEASALMVPTS